MEEIKARDFQSGGSGVSRPASARLLDMLKPLATPTRLDKGQDLFSQGDEADALYVVVDGVLEISTLSEDGRRLAHILLKPGTVFGEVALFDGGQRSATVSAKQKAELLRIARVDLLNEIQNNSGLAVELLQLTIGRLRWMSAQLEDHVFQSVPVRLARRLNFLFMTMSTNSEIRISQSELAEHVGATREAVSKILSQWRETGVVQLGRGKITILDPVGLADLADLGTI